MKKKKMPQIPLSRETMRAICDWLVSNPAVHSHRLNAEPLTIYYDTPAGTTILNEGDTIDIP